MKRRSMLGAALIVLCVGLCGCSATGEDKKQAAKVAERSPVAVEVARISSEDITDGIDVVGSLSSKFGAEVKSEYTGIVTEVSVNEWVKVKKGDPLARLDTREIDVFRQKAKAAVEVAKANLLQAEVATNRVDREYERASKLKEFGLITQQNLDDARTEQQAAYARIAAAKAQLKVAEEDVRQAETRLSKAVIHSPMDGVVSLRNVNVGDFVGEMGAKPMFRIVDNRTLELTVTVPSAEMAAIRVGQPLTFSTVAIPGKSFKGQVMFINPVVNEADRSVKVVAEVDNTDGQLKGGLFVQGRILVGQRTGVIKVPRMALLTWDVAGNKADLLVVDAGIAHRKTISTGNPSGDKVEVASGFDCGNTGHYSGWIQCQRRGKG